MVRLTHRYMDGEAWASIFKVTPCGEQEVKGEIISRLAAYEDTGLEPFEIYLLRAQQEGKTGYWIGEGDGYADGELVYDVWHCSECDYTIDDGTDDPDCLPKYCPNCGAKMGRCAPEKEGT